MTTENSVSEAARTDSHVREALVRELIAQIQGISLSCEQIGHVYATQRRLHNTDFKALTAIHRAEREGTPLTARQLADTLSVSPGAVTYLVDRLAAEGHVYRDSDAKDRRRVLLRTADNGRETASQFFKPLAEAHQETMARYSEEELTVCLRFLSDVHASIDTFGVTLQSADD